MEAVSYQMWKYTKLPVDRFSSDLPTFVNIIGVGCIDLSTIRRKQ